MAARALAQLKRPGTARVTGKAPAGVCGDRPGGDVGWLAQAIGEVAVGGVGAKAGAHRVVGVEDAGFGDAGFAGSRGQALEEPGLGRDVGLEGLVVVQVLGGDIGEDRHVVGAAQRSSLVQGVRGRLQDGVAQAPPDHRRQQALDGQGVGRGGVRASLLPLVSQEGADGGDGAGGMAGGGQDRLEHQAGGGLAVGAGHADDHQAVAGMAVEGAGQVGQGGPPVGHQDVGERVGRLDRALGDDGHGSALAGLGDVAVAVDLDPLVGDEERSWSDLTGVGGQVADQKVGRGRVEDFPPGQGGQEVSQPPASGEDGSRGRGASGSRHNQRLPER